MDNKTYIGATCGSVKVSDANPIKDKVIYTILEICHRTGGMGHISAFSYANLISWGYKMRANFCSTDLAHWRSASHYGFGVDNS